MWSFFFCYRSFHYKKYVCILRKEYRDRLDQKFMIFLLSLWKIKKKNSVFNKGNSKINIYLSIKLYKNILLNQILVWQTNMSMINYFHLILSIFLIMNVLKFSKNYFLKRKILFKSLYLYFWSCVWLPTFPYFFFFFFMHVEGKTTEIGQACMS